MVEQQILDCNGVQVRCLMHGDGPTMLYLHGFTGRAENGKRVIKAFSERYQVIAPDLRGHGYSDAADRYRIDDYANDCMALLDRFDTPAVLYGHSLGGLIVLAIAGLRPDLVSKVIAEDPPLFHRSRSMTDHPATVGFRRQYEERKAARSVHDLFSRLRALYPDAPVDQIVQLSDRLITCDPGIWDALLADRLYDALDIDALFAATTAPVLLLQGNAQRGAVLYDEDIESVQKTLTVSQRRFYEAAGHSVMKDATDAVVADVSAFLEEA